MSEQKPCVYCGAPHKQWYYPRLQMNEVMRSNSMIPFVLNACNYCGQLWLEYWYEPWSAYIHTVVWPGAASHARYLMNHEQERNKLILWHAGRVVEEADRAKVDMRGMGAIPLRGEYPKFEDLNEEPG